MLKEKGPCWVWLPPGRIERPKHRSFMRSIRAENPPGLNIVMEGRLRGLMSEACLLPARIASQERRFTPQSLPRGCRGGKKPQITTLS